MKFSLAWIVLKQHRVLRVLDLKGCRLQPLKGGPDELLKRRVGLIVEEFQASLLLVLIDFQVRFDQIVLVKDGDLLAL